MKIYILILWALLYRIITAGPIKLYDRRRRPGHYIVYYTFRDTYGISRWDGEAWRDWNNRRDLRPMRVIRPFRHPSLKEYS